MLLMWMPDVDTLEDAYKYPASSALQFEITYTFGTDDTKRNCIGVRVGATWYYTKHNSVQSEWNNIALTYGINRLDAYKNGEWQSGNNSMTGNMDTNGASDTFTMGSGLDRKIRHMFIFNRFFLPAEAVAISRDPYQCLKPRTIGR